MMAAQAEPNSNPHRARLAAIRLQSSRMKRLDTDLAAAKKRWATELGDATQAFNALLPKHEADLPDDARERLVDLYKAHAKSKELEGDKKKDVDKLSKRLKAATARFWELVDAEVEEAQMGLSLGDASLADGLGVSNEAAREVFAEIREVEKAGGKLDADTADLKRRLEAQGFTDLTLDDDEEEEEQEDEPPSKASESTRDHD